MPSKKRTLLVASSLTVPTGFGNATANLLRHLTPDQWSIHCLAIDASGDPHPMQRDWRIYPASLGGDVFGVQRIAPLTAAVRPDVLVLHNDPWHCAAQLAALRAGLPEGEQPPVVVYTCPDAPNQAAGKDLSGVALLISTTHFGVDALRRGGYCGPSAVLPYGVDRTTFYEMSQSTARRQIGLDESYDDAFIVGRADRNQPRKRYDLMLRYWKHWYEEAGKPHAYLHIHAKPVDVGWDLPQLARYYGIADRVIMPADLDVRHGVSPDTLRSVYNAWDVHASTTMGEGFGLVALESAACGVRQILPDYSAYGELWKARGANLIPIWDEMATPDAINTIGGIVNERGFVDALHDAYSHRLTEGPEDAARRARAEQFDWTHIGSQFEALLLREARCGVDSTHL